jgi:hypothetical protein
MTAPREESSERVLERLVGNIARKEERQRLYEELIADRESTSRPPTAGRSAGSRSRSRSPSPS